jgi:hypothetical protein
MQTTLGVLPITLDAFPEKGTSLPKGYNSRCFSPFLKRAHHFRKETTLDVFASKMSVETAVNGPQKQTTTDGF